jgi:N-dimethylarginine dimethylaminohydrolase
MHINIHSEFQPLEEVVVGAAHVKDAFYYSDDPDLKNGLETILGETAEDLNVLVKIFEENGVTVKRPENLFSLGQKNKANKIDLNLFDFTFPNHPLMPRDTVLVIGDKIIQTYTKSENRYLENWAYYKLFNEYFQKGAHWISMPPPFFEGPVDTYSIHNQKKILFHAANILKCGRDIFYSQPSRGPWEKAGRGTDIGLEWIKRVIGPDYRFHGAPCAGHLDGKIALLKPGVLATWNPAHVPELMQKWDMIVVDSPSPFPEYFKEIKKKRFYKEFVQQWLKEWIGYVDETVFDVNMLSISENKVITNGYNESAFKQLKSKGIEAIPWNFRHQYFWDGAIHCVTLDTRRTGSLENYF